MWDRTSDLEPGLLQRDLWIKSRKIPEEDESFKARKEVGQPLRRGFRGRKADLSKWWCSYPNGIRVPGSETKRLRLDLVLMVSPLVSSSLELQELIQCVEVSWPPGHTISLFHKAHTLSSSAFSFTFSLALPFPTLFVASSLRLSLWDLYHISLCSCLGFCPISSSPASPHSPPIAPFKSQSFPHRTAISITVSRCLTLASFLSSHCQTLYLDLGGFLTRMSLTSPEQPLRFQTSAAPGMAEVP